MRERKLDLIRRYCDTTGMRLSEADKDLLCMILENPGIYNGFTTRVYEKPNEGRDPYKGRWHSTTNWQYRINIGSTLSIDERYRHACDDGKLNADHWSWSNAYHITDLRRIKDILWEIRNEL